MSCLHTAARFTRRASGLIVWWCLGCPHYRTGWTWEQIDGTRPGRYIDATDAGTWQFDEYTPEVGL